MIKNSNQVLFIKLVTATIFSLYLLIAIGGIVRSTGSGMGCPDWPKCFGKWIPPTSISELPEDYKEVYSEKRKAKNLKLSSYLRFINFPELAIKIQGDLLSYTEADFNPLKTWIEYINRVIGVVIGFLIFAVFVYSIKFIKQYPSITLLSFAAFILVGLEGWLGSIVVSTNLLPFMVTVHMGVALIIVCLLIYLLVKIKSLFISDKNIILSTSQYGTGFSFLIICACVATFCQILLGTQVREEVDTISSQVSIVPRELWIDMLTNIFKYHRSFSILILLLNGYLFFNYYRKRINKNMDTMFLFLAGIILSEIFAGIILAYFAIPAFFQPIHLILGCLLFGIQTYILFNVLLPNTYSRAQTI